MPTTKARVKVPAASPTLFGAGVLRKIGAPVTKNNLHVFGVWLANEQTAATWASDHLNPLGVTNASGTVAPLGSFSQAISTTAHTLLSNHAYAGIVTNFRRNAPARKTSQSIVLSPWNGSHYGGLDKFLAAAPLTKAPSPSAGSSTSSGLNWNTLSEDATRIVGMGFLGPLGGQVLPQPQKSAVSVYHGAQTVAQGVSSIGGLISDITNPTKLHDVGLFAAGAALAVVGIALLMSQSRTASLAQAVALK